MHPHHSQAITLRLATPAEILPLRHAILRPGQPLSASLYPNDHSPTTLHAAAFLATDCIACATLLHEPYDTQPAYRLRGMAVHPNHQRQGLGRSLLQFLLPHAAQHASLLWCNARLPAVPFYQSQGWQITGPLFQIPEAGGPHHRMLLPLHLP